MYYHNKYHKDPLAYNDGTMHTYHLRTRNRNKKNNNVKLFRRIYTIIGISFLIIFLLIPLLIVFLLVTKIFRIKYNSDLIYSFPKCKICKSRLSVIVINRESFYCEDCFNDSK